VGPPAPLPALYKWRHEDQVQGAHASGQRHSGLAEAKDLQERVDFPRLTYVGEKLDSDDLVGAAEVAAILRLSHPSSVTTYLRRYPDFPKPVVNLSASRVRLWRRQDVERWSRDRAAS
jgi:hypothetical protein